MVLAPGGPEPELGLQPRRQRDLALERHPGDLWAIVLPALMGDQRNTRGQHRRRVAPESRGNMVEELAVSVGGRQSRESATARISHLYGRHRLRHKSTPRTSWTRCWECC